MAKMWAGRTTGITSKVADDFNSSVSFDCRMFEEDITGSMVHALMLANQNIISHDEAKQIVDGLASILEDLKADKLEIDPSAEDIHMFVEQVLTERIGVVGKKLHTARSRNDQVALDMKMYVRKEITSIESKLKDLIKVIVNKAETYKKTIMPGYTHLQRAQPIVYGQELLAYAFMFERDLSRLEGCKKRLNVSPIGSCALAGTTYNTDRVYEAKNLGFDKVTLNSIDGVSDRDYLVELLSDLSLIMVHISRLSEELVLFSSWEFKFITLDDAFTTGSSIMPQKKNSDMAELARGKSGRVFGSLMAMLTVLKGLPLAYNKDMQEDKENTFDAIDTVKMVIDVFIPMMDTLKANEENMLKAAQKGFINATDLADYLTKKGMPFREAYKLTGEIVNKCINENKVLEDLTLEEYKQLSPLFENDLYNEISLTTCVGKRNSLGGTSFKSVEDQINYFRNTIK